MNLIELRRISKGSTSIRNLDLDVRPGEVFSLGAIAPTDCSRLARILSLDENGWSGEFFLMGLPVHQCDAATLRELRRNYLGVVLTDERLIPELTIGENLELPLTLRTRRAERDGVIEPILELLNIAELRACYPRALSRRETQLARIARAVVGGPSVIIADDLSGCLRSDDWARVCMVLRGVMTRGTGIVLTREDEVQALCGKAALPGLERHRIEGEAMFPATATQ